MAALRMGAREWALLVFLSLLWGGAFFFAAVAIKQIDPFTLAFLRMSIAALALAAVGAVLGHKLPRDPTLWTGFLVLGVVGTAAPFSLIYMGQTQISGGLASIINSATPLWTIVVAHFFTRDEKFTVRRLVGVLAGLAGVGVIMAPSAGLPFGEGHLLAEASVLAGGLCYAIAGVFGKRFRAVPPVVMACGQLAAGAVLILPIMFVFGSPLASLASDLSEAGGAPGLSLAVIGAVLAVALLSTALAFIIYFEILRAAGATNVMLVTLLVPVSAIFLGALILGEDSAPRHFAGLTLIAIGLMIIDGRLPNYIRSLLGGGGDASGLPPRSVLKDAQNP